MDIVQTPARFYPYVGGTEQVAFHLSRELVRKGHSVKVICADEPKAADGVVDGIRVKRIPYVGKFANTNITLSLTKELMKERFDIIHTHLPHPWTADISSFVAAVKRKPLFLTYHNDITGRGVAKIVGNIYNFTALKVLLRRACKIFITRRNYIGFSSYLNEYRKKLVISPPGVDLEHFAAKKAENNQGCSLFFLSVLDQFHRYKGLECLLKSIQRLTPKLPLKLYIGGAGKLLGYYRDFVVKNKLDNFVQFLGFLDEGQLVKYYNLCDIFILPSISAIQEGFGLVALEAMACKKAVVVSDIVGVAADVAKYNTGIVVAPDNTEELTSALEYLFVNADKRRQMGDNGYSLVKTRYTWQNHADIVEKEYKKLF